MCGIAGFLDKSENNEHRMVGRTVLAMLEALGCRGPDSAGVALYGMASNGGLVLRVKLGERGDLEPRARQALRAAQAFGAVLESSTIGPYLRLRIDECADPNALVDAIEALDPDIEVVSAGRRLEIVKQVGSPANLEKSYGISRFCGTHGLGHTRLSTESRVDLSHSQPFWGHGRPDLAIIHNGHITNYHQLRRRYEQRGTRFYTENDSEIVAIYLAERLGQGASLEEAMRGMLRDLDGSFSCLAATAEEFGFVKDPFALKPLTYTETDDFVAVATEEIAIRSALPGDYTVREAQVKQVQVWQR